jgi:hypothetical protein
MSNLPFPTRYPQTNLLFPYVSPEHALWLVAFNASTALYQAHDMRHCRSFNELGRRYSQVNERQP